jgi:hypothetical protein
VLDVFDLLVAAAVLGLGTKTIVWCIKRLNDGSGPIRREDDAVAQNSRVGQVERSRDAGP